MTSFKTALSSKRTKGALAIATGAALLAGGSTFAMWASTDSMDGAQINVGDQGISISGGTWMDISPEHEPMEIDLDDFKIVPGDVLTSTYDIDLVAIGSNFHGAVTVNVDEAIEGGDGSDGTDGSDGSDGAEGTKLPGQVRGDGFTLTYNFVDERGNPLSETDTLTLVSEDSTVGDDAAHIVPKEGSTVYMTITAEFDQDVPPSIAGAAAVSLGKITVDLAQIR